MQGQISNLSLLYAKTAITHQMDGAKQSFQLDQDR